MKLRGPEERKAKRLSVVVEPEHLVLLERYRAYYRDMYGEEIDFGEMMVQLAAASVDSDRTFKQWSRQRSSPGHAAAPQ